jgi:hypothetical protein
MAKTRYYKHQAARARQIAKTASRPEVAVLLERLAQNFEDMAFAAKS